MQLSFSKYQGTGNDFIILDAWNSNIELSESQIKFCCDRNFGVGADGLMIIKKCVDADFEMIYFNSDGLPGSMCGNGSRCIVHYAFTKKYISKKTRFLATDGMHEAEILEDAQVSLKMCNVNNFEKRDNDFYLNTGSPHYIIAVNGIEKFAVVDEARKIRYNGEFSVKGTNVNFVQPEEDGISVRTYERGVEDETLSCGTGVTAVALVSADIFHLKKNKSELINIITPGGKLKVSFERNHMVFENIHLIGPATFVFEGSINL